METSPAPVVVSPDRTWLTVPLESGSARFHAIWLRDNARNQQTVSATNGQRLITLLDQCAAPAISDAWISDDQLSLHLTEDPVEYRYTLSWLDQHRYDRHCLRSEGWIDPTCTVWDAALSDALPSADYTEIKSDERALMRWLQQIREFGFSKLTGLKAQPGEILEVTSLFGYIRETNYGCSFDVRTEVEAENLAFTAAGLQVHTDNPYRDPVPTLQLLACLTDATEGGDSIVVDGFQAAQQLQHENAEHFDLLTRYCARFHYHGDGKVHLSASKPILELAVDRALTAVRFNNRSAAPFIDIPFEQMASFYAAYRHLAEILERTSMQVKFRLASGELFVVNNSRVLHGRSAFSGSGQRWLQGCYADIDGLNSTLALLEQKYTPMSPS